MREVTVIMHYAIPDHKVTGELISPFYFTFPSKTDVVDSKEIETLRKFWRDALTRRHPEADTTIKNKPLEEKLRDIMAAAIRPAQEMTTEEALVVAAKYPIPSEYVVVLPPKGKSLRQEIIETLVPFRDTRAMLLRLENNLESPMRVLQIGHTSVSSTEELRAAANLTSGRFVLN